MAEPIWKDYFVDLGAPATSGAGVPFYIECVERDASIFEGVAYPKPGESNAVVRINDICANYLSRYFLEQPDATLPARAVFHVYATTSGSPVLKGNVRFYNNWSYDPFYNPETDGMNFPIIPVFAQGQFIPVSVWGATAPTADVHMPSGIVYHPTLVKSRDADFNNDYNEDFLLGTQYFGDSYLLPMKDYIGAVKVVVAGKTYNLSKHCPQFVLYYANSYGGWDALPIEGRAVKADAVTRYTNECVYDNSRALSRGKVNFLNDMKRTFALHTGWLTQDQASRMHNILNSPCVLMHDLESGLVHPVVLTNSTTEYKNGAGMLHTYTIEAELAQERIRR